ncbi:MAG: hypothetical protein JST00_11880 [Deltaproteobacteria bacterium]|nr:hypothetical protein [Deltaproteobacteria bacterium]
MRVRTWLQAVLLFFVWGFVMHAAGLLLHEFGGHALAAVIFGCGIKGYDLTFFGHGQVHYTRCERWTDTTILLADWAGLFVTIGAGLGAGIFLWRRQRALPPLTRLFVAEVAMSFLLGQLAYMTTGGFHDLYDPGRTAHLLGQRGLHVVAWLPPLVAFGVVAFLFSRIAVDAFREHFGSRSRLHTLGQIAITVGVAGLLYYVAFRLEIVLRADMTMKGVAHEAQRIATVRKVAPPFPIDKVLDVLAFAGAAYALGRAVRAPEPAASAPPEPPPRLVKIVVGSAAAFFALLFVMIVLR